MKKPGKTIKVTFKAVVFPVTLKQWLLFLWLIISTGYSTINGQEIKPVRVGILTDCQYCNCPSIGKRNYRLSLLKLDSCIAVLNPLSLDAIFHLGDMIDHDYSSFDSVLPRFGQFRPPLHLVLGNHDYMIKKKFKHGLPERIGMKEDHYTVDLDSWRFIVLNGDDLSYVAPQDKKQKEERNDIVNDQYSQVHLNGLPWNGGIGRDQMNWLKERLDESQQSHLKVIVVCHFPLFTKDNHNLFNNKELFNLISRYACVKAYFNGHYHSGSYKVRDGIHLVNFMGMVDTQMNSFAVVTLTSDSILIKGYGREPDRNLKIR
jgi:manganese-dependent ADP-ribose/CDP-alcohol diphosphatase